MTDLQQLPLGFQRSQLIALIEESQAKALRTLRESGVPEAHILAVMPRIKTYCVFALNEFDQALLTIDQVVAKEGRTMDQQKRVNDKAFYYLHSIEAGIADVLALAIRQVIETARQPPAQPVITPPLYVPSSPPFLQTFLVVTIKLLLWLCAFPASLLLGYQLTGSEWWQLLFPLVLLVVWILFRFSWWGMIFPVTILSTVSLLYLLPTAYH
jgi:hypothetical protein